MDNNFIKFTNKYIPEQDEIKRNIINSEEFKKYYETEIQRQRELQMASNTNIITREAYLQNLFAMQQQAGNVSYVNNVSNVSNVNNVSNISNVNNTNTYNEFLTNITNNDNRVNNTLNYSNTNQIMSGGTGAVNAIENKVKAIQRRTAVNIDTKSNLINKKEYPNTNDFKIFLGRTFYNIRSIELLKIELPNTSPVIDTNNNKIYWINQEDIEDGIINTVTQNYPVYSITLTPGSYSSENLEKEIQLKMSQVKRRNGTGDFHYFIVDINRETNVVEFVSQILQSLSTNPISCTADSDIITISAPNHGFSAGDTVYIHNAFSVGGIPSGDLNKEHLVLSVTNINAFTIEITTKALSTTSGGGNLVRIGKLAPFQLYFGEYDDVIANNIGYNKENSSDRINTDIDFIKNTDLIYIETVNDHNLGSSDLGSYIFINDSSTIPDIDTLQTNIYNQVVKIIDSKKLLIMSYDFSLSTVTSTVTIGSTTTVSNQIIFPNSASSQNDYYLGWFLKSDNDIRQITSYSGSSKIATINENWIDEDTLITSTYSKSLENRFFKNIDLSEDYIYFGTNTWLNSSQANVNNSSGNILIYNRSNLTTFPNTTITPTITTTHKFPLINLTSNSQGFNGLNYVTLDSYTTGNSYKAFDENNNVEWSSGSNYNSTSYTGLVSTTYSSGSVNGDWLQIDVGQSIKLDYFVIKPSSTFYITRSPKLFKLLGGNDGTNWNLLYTSTTISNWTASDKTFTITDNQNNYSYYRLVVEQTLAYTAGSTCVISELQFWGNIVEDAFSFGQSVSIPYNNSNLILAGAPYSSFWGSVGSTAGSFYKLQFTNNTWNQTRINSPLTYFSNGNSLFGSTLSTNLNGDFIIVGAPNKDTGYAYVYYFDDSFFRVTTNDINVNFGYSVCSSNVSGDTMQNRFVVSDPLLNQGTIYVYDTKNYKVTDTTYNFASSYAASSNDKWLIVGNGYISNTGGSATVGSLKIYEKSGDWIEVPFQSGFIINGEYIENTLWGLSTSGNSTVNGYGYKIAVTNEDYPTIAITTQNESSGSFRIIHFDGDLTPIPSYVSDNFTVGINSYGHSTALSEDSIVAVTSAPYGTCGSVYIYTKTFNTGATANAYTLHTELTNSNTAFGANLALSTNGTLLLISSHNESTGGAVYIRQNTTPTGGSWANIDTLYGSNINGLFGWSIACSGNAEKLVVSELATRTVYFYEKSGSTWGSTFSISKQINLFGNNVSMSQDGNSFIVTSADFSTPYLYRWMGSYWQETQLLDNPVSNNYTSLLSSLNSIYLGSSLTKSIDVLDLNFTNPLKITPSDGVNGDLFGSSVDITPDGNTIVASSPNHNTGRGAIYVYKKSITSWNESKISLITSNTGENPGRFNNISINEHANIILLGSESDNAVYKFVLENNTWGSTKITSESSFFGKSVATKGKDSIKGFLLDSSSNTYKDGIVSNKNSFPQIGDDVQLFDYPYQTELSLSTTRNTNSNIAPYFTFDNRQIDINLIKNFSPKYVNIKTKINHNYNSSDINSDIRVDNTLTLPSLDNEQSIEGVYNNKNILILGALNTESTSGTISTKNPFKSNIRYILSATTGSTTTFQTDYEHKLQIGDSVKFYNISAFPLTLENQIFTVLNVPNSTTFSIDFITGLVNISSDSYIGYGLIEVNFSSHGFNYFTSIDNGIAPGLITIDTLLPHNITLNEFKSITETNCVPSIDDLYKIVNISDDNTFSVYYTDNLVNGTLGTQNVTLNNQIILPSQIVGNTDYTNYFIQMLSGEFQNVYGLLTTYNTTSKIGLIQGPLGENLLLGTNTTVTIPSVSQNFFGSYVKISGDRTTLFTADSNEFTSHIYVYKATLGNNWLLNSTITKDDTSFNPIYSYSWTIDSNTAGTSFIVGDSTALNYSGQALIFDYDGNTWNETKLSGGPFDEFGISVAMSDNGQIVAVGAWTEDDSSQESDGAVYIYRKSTGWSTTASQIISETTANKNLYFGRSVKLSGDGDTLFVGSVFGNSDNSNSSGAVYVYDWSGSTWGSPYVIKPNTATIEDDFGIDFACSEAKDRLAVYARYDRDYIYVYKWESSTSTWDETLITSSGKAIDFNNGNVPSISNNIAMSRDGFTIVVIRENSTNQYQQIYKYELINSIWVETLLLEAESEYIKYQVTMVSNDYILVGQLEKNPLTADYNTSSKNLILYIGKSLELNDRFALYSYDSSFSSSLQDQQNYNVQTLNKINISSLLHSTTITNGNFIEFSTGENNGLYRLISSHTTGTSKIEILLSSNLNAQAKVNDSISHYYILNTIESTNVSIDNLKITETTGNLGSEGDALLFTSATINTNVTLENIISKIIGTDSGGGLFNYYYNIVNYSTGNISSISLSGDVKFLQSDGFDVLPNQQFNLNINQALIPNTLSSTNKALVTNGNFIMFTTANSNENLIRSITSTSIDTFGNILVTFNTNLNTLTQLGDTFKLYAQPIKEPGTIGYIDANNQFYLYNSNDVGGIDSTVINNNLHQIREILDENRFLFYVNDFSQEEVFGGGFETYINSLIHGFNGIQSNLRVNQVQRAISLEGENYVFVCCPQLDTLLNTTEVPNVFARVSVDNRPNSIVFSNVNNYISYPKEFIEAPLQKLEDIEISIKKSNGELYNINNLDWSMVLLVTEELIMDQTFNFSSKSGLNIGM